MSEEGRITDLVDMGDASKGLSLLDDKAVAGGATAPSRTLTGSVTFRKEGLFDRQFLYGFDLQYRSGNDAQLSLIPQAQAVGHVPAFFRRLGDELQLVADQTRLFESDVNHPELLLTTYDVVAEDDDTITVRFAHGGVVINEVSNGKGADLPKHMWIRSLTYVEEGNYLLQESALMLKDGSVQTYMESLFPRSNLVPENFTPLKADGTKEPLAKRYRFLATDKVYVPTQVDGQMVRTQTTFATRFLVDDAQTIDWYVTPNIPDKFLPVVKGGVEGWNRYFESQMGRKVMQFKGRLPAGISLGDPRYNVINFDTVAEAGAAYESQAFDPLTGIQSHSIIYLPYAWYNVGVSLWKKRMDPTSVPSRETFSDAVSPKSPEVLLGENAKVLRCMRSAADVMLPPAMILAATSNDKVATPASVDEFGMRVMLSTLFHEMGHALGLAHNFKGSLAFDGTRDASADNPATWSIMDYNYYHNEVGLFGEIGTSGGPILEYDRQIISQLYNKGAQVKASDPVIPACEDSEADATKSGVDPLCVRYDVENDPSQGVAHAYHNATAAQGAIGIESKTLSEALGAVKPLIYDKFSSAAKIPSGALLDKEVKDLSANISQLISYYLVSGAQALRANLMNNGKMLRMFSDDVKLADEAAFRTRYLVPLKNAMGWRTLPEAPMAALLALRTALKTAVIANTALGASEAERAILGDAAQTLLQKSMDDTIGPMLEKLRTGVYDELKYKNDNSFAFGLGNDKDAANLEDLAVGLLHTGVVMGLDGSADTIAAFQAERLAAAAVLATFKGNSTGVDDAVTALNGFVAQGKLNGNSKLVRAAREVIERLEKSP